MRVLFIGDVVGESACRRLGGFVRNFRRECGVDLVIINGENSANGNGITHASARLLFDAGADCITTGNHAYKQKEATTLYKRGGNVVCPANIGESLTLGYTVMDFGRVRVGVVNLLGCVFMKPCENPFKTADEIIDALRREGVKIIITDFHAEATAEKKAMFHHLRGRVSALFGTHTHVQTADECVLGGTAYITDAGMTGVWDCALGVRADIIVDECMFHLPQKYELAVGEMRVNGVFTEIDEASGNAVLLERINTII